MRTRCIAVLMTTWSAAQYVRFEDERSRAAAELLARVPLAAPQLVVDLGCGPGNSTHLLVDRWPSAKVVGLDSSADMLAAARKRLPGLTFLEADVADWAPAGDEDLLFANAVFQWVPDHLGVMARLLAALRPGAVLAVQMPDNLAEPSHRAMVETAQDGPWRDRLRDAAAARELLPPPEAYYDTLAPLAAAVDIWHTVYNIRLDGPEAVVAWVEGAGLRPFLEPLDPAARAAYRAAYTRRICAAYPPRINGKVLLRFPRLFVVAVRR